jgi:hypothetical protein
MGESAARKYRKLRVFNALNIPTPPAFTNSYRVNALPRSAD